MSRALYVIFLMSLALTQGITAFAADRKTAGNVHPFSDGEKSFIGGVGLALGVFEAKKDLLAPDECWWCGTNTLDDSMRDLFRRDTGSGRTRAARWSDLTGFGSGLVLIGMNALAAHDGNHEEIEANSLTVVESGLVSLTLSNIVKRIAARQRPFLREPDEGRLDDPDDNLSFYSGHTTLAFAVAVSAGRMADLQGYKSAPAIWAAGLTLAAATGYFRMASDKHYFTDVVAGAATGSIVGLVAANRRRLDDEVGTNATAIRIVIRTDGQSLGVAVQ